MQRRPPRPLILAASLAALCLLAGAFTVHAEEPDGHHRHRFEKVLVGEGYGPHRALVELLGSKGGFLGVHLTELTPELRVHFGAPEDAGVLVARVVEGSPAEGAGLRVGDVLTRIDGEDVDSAWSVKRLIGEREDGDAATLEVWRDGRVETLTATIEEREGQGPLRHAWALRCEDGEDCDFDFGDFDFGGHFGGVHFACEGDERCDVTVECHDGDCDCTVNGEDADCGVLHLPRLHEEHDGK